MSFSNMLCRSIVAASAVALVVTGAVLAATTTKNVAISVTHGGGGGGGLTPPAPVVAAFGSNAQLVYNADFSAPAYASKTSPGFFNLPGGWYGPLNDQGSTHELYHTNLFARAGTQAPDSVFVPSTPDPGNGGAITLAMNWLGSFCNGGCFSGGTGTNDNATLLVNTGNYNGAAGHPGGSAFSLPTNVYIEGKFRVSSDPVGPVTTFDGFALAAYTFDWADVAGVYDVLEVDPMLFQMDGFGYVGDAFNQQTGDPKTSLFEYNTGTLNLSSAPHTFGALIRYDGSSGNGHGTMCSYLDNVLVGSCVDLKPTAQQVISSNRNVITIGPGNSTTNFTMYTYFVRAWTRAAGAGCNNLQADNCLGPVN